MFTQDWSLGCDVDVRRHAEGTEKEEGAETKNQTHRARWRRKQRLKNTDRDQETCSYTCTQIETLIHMHTDRDLGLLEETEKKTRDQAEEQNRGDVMMYVSSITFNCFPLLHKPARSCEGKSGSVREEGHVNMFRSRHRHIHQQIDAHVKRRRHAERRT